MTIRQHAPVRLCQEDADALADALERARGHDTGTALRLLLPGLGEAERSAVAAHCALAHVAVMVFPPSIGLLRAALTDLGLTVGPPTPSTVVRERVARRHGLDPAGLDVVILRAAVPVAGGNPREVEVFALATDDGTRHGPIAARERAERNESHVAFGVPDADEVVLAGLRALLTGPGAMRADGGGHNAHEDTTVLYFRTPPGEPDGTASPSGEQGQRLELGAPGRFESALTAHTAATHAPWTPDTPDTPDHSPAEPTALAGPTVPTEPARRLLELMTGAWATQAVAVTAELGIADHLPAPGTPDEAPAVPELAERVGARPDPLARLLRYLAALGLLERRGDTYALSATGRLLREDAPRSLRPLALLYGGPFYRSFAELAHSVRTGGDGFARLHGRGHFDHFAADPRLADLFERAMAASAEMFDPIPGLVDLSTASVVVDVAGGNGELLAGILTRHPHLRGVLLERPGTLEAARERLARAGCADRCTFVAGDFTTSVPTGGDVYLLSRVLHDWDDETCAALLRRCAAAMAPGARLLLVERVLPEDSRPSLAPAWDVHMLCNVGGRERTAAHYGRLLTAAGFTPGAVSPLPLDAHLIRARRTPSPEPSHAPHS
ncbi:MULTISPECIES: methyltransferase [unclassified Streptomyces]|uniref:methyltransferase n=1 Tax=unclassified Streptomyces TaxID=2593676 RepID=UPI00381A4DEA